MHAFTYEHGTKTDQQATSNTQMVSTPVLTSNRTKGRSQFDVTEAGEAMVRRESQVSTILDGRAGLVR